jgi:hypothetical protein
MKRTAWILAAALAAVALLAVPTAAGAPPETPPGLELTGKTEVRTLPPQAGGQGFVIETTTSRNAVRVDKEKLAEVGDLRAVGSGRTLASAAATSTIWYREWSQRTQSVLWGIAWSETHRGGYFFNGNYVWLSSRFGWDNYGWHRCDYNSGIAFSVSVISCYKQGDPSTWRMRNGDQFRVSVIYSGFPIYATHEMAACMGPGGGLWGC